MEDHSDDYGMFREIILGDADDFPDLEHLTSWGPLRQQERPPTAQRLIGLYQEFLAGEVVKLQDEEDQALSEETEFPSFPETLGWHSSLADAWIALMKIQSACDAGDSIALIDQCIQLGVDLERMKLRILYDEPVSKYRRQRNRLKTFRRGANQERSAEAQQRRNDIAERFCEFDRQFIGTAVSLTTSRERFATKEGVSVSTLKRATTGYARPKAK